MKGERKIKRGDENDLEFAFSVSHNLADNKIHILLEGVNLAII